MDSNNNKLMAKRLRELRKKKGVSQFEVAKYLGIERPTYTAYESGASRPVRYIDKLSEYFNVSIDYIYGISDFPLSNEIALPEDIKKIPIIATVKCGPDGLAFEEDNGYVNVDVRHGEDLRAFRCKGDSMINEGIHDGDIAIVRIQNEVESGQMAIVVINGDEGTLKKVRYQSDAIILESANPAYPARVFTGVDRAVVHIVGRVIETRRSWR